MLFKLLPASCLPLFHWPSKSQGQPSFRAEERLHFLALGAAKSHGKRCGHRSGRNMWLFLQSTTKWKKIFVIYRKHDTHSLSCRKNIISRNSLNQKACGTMSTCPREFSLALTIMVCVSGNISQFSIRKLCYLDFSDL